MAIQLIFARGLRSYVQDETVEQEHHLLSGDHHRSYKPATPGAQPRWSSRIFRTRMLPKLIRMKYMPFFLFQILLMVLFFIFTKYGGATNFDIKGFEDTHVMIFVGFGFLMTFLKKYCYSALGLNWFLAAMVVQWALLNQAFYSMEDNTIQITKKSLLEADIMSATVLITFGALLGYASALQLLVIAIIETVVGCFNFWIVEHIFVAADVGGSIGIHTFGAYFGLAASLGLGIRRKKVEPIRNLNEPSYSSDVTAMIGSIFLWIYWPSFNSALTSSNMEYQRAVINSYLSLAAATVTTFAWSAAVCKEESKFDMVHIQNSTLAGGVAVGAVCNMHIQPGGAIAVGIGAGILSVIGYRYITPAMEKMGISDTCGVHNLHGMPGVFSGILSAIFAAIATPEVYGDDLHGVFEARQVDGSGITAKSQALNQIYALLATLAISSVGGLLTGLLVRIPILGQLHENEKYDDRVNWEVPEEH